jgi:hypothetical protein
MLTRILTALVGIPIAILVVTKGGCTVCRRNLIPGSGGLA